GAVWTNEGERRREPVAGRAAPQRAAEVPPGHCAETIRIRERQLPQVVHAGPRDSGTHERLGTVAGRVCRDERSEIAPGRATEDGDARGVEREPRRMSANPAQRSED